MKPLPLSDWICGFSRGWPSSPLEESSLTYPLRHFC
jgi:hypothetical protein